MQQQQHLVQMQQQQQPMNMMAAYYPNNVTTDHIQQYLDENKSLILKIVESQNSGKLNECAENQARLQRNLMYLAAIADSQPQQPNMHSQYAASGVLPSSAHYLQHQQSQQMPPQSIMATRSLYGQQTYPSLQQQTLHSQLGMSSGGSSGGLMLQGEPHGNTGSLGSGGFFPDFIRNSGGDVMQSSGSKRDIGSVSGEGRGGSDGGENLYLKRGDDGN